MKFDIEPIMLKCIDIAQRNQTPFGAALVNDRGEVLELAANSTATDGPVFHAEMNVLKNAHLFPEEQLFLVTTCEPCPMCAGAAIWAKVKGICYGASIGDASQYMKQISVSSQQIVEASWVEMDIVGGVLREECIELFR